MSRSFPVRSTYRLQFHRDFPFPAAAELAGYLSQLGVSHVYASPILRARAGSLHGYDVTGYDAINPELGGEAGFREMAEAFRAAGLGIILDIVPNHVAVGGDDNEMWLDLLKRGRTSRYATWFDIEFDDADPLLAGKVHAPFLGEPLQDALEQDKLEVVDDVARQGYALRYGEHLFPIRPEDEPEIAASGLAVFRDRETLRELIERQNFHLDYWRTASDRLNWRRFFEVTQLAGIRMEEPEAFEAAHRIALTFYREGLVDGLRIDHIDGLADPAAYCSSLRRRLAELETERPDWAAAGPALLLVEKILAPGETLPPDWQTDGTTGYDFMDEVSALQHDPQGEVPLGLFWSEISGRSANFADEEHAARKEVLEHGFEGQLEYVVDMLMALATESGRQADIPRGAMRRATSAVCCHLRTYRTYLTGASAPETPGRFFDEAMEQARAQPQAEHLALDFIEGALTGSLGDLPAEPRRKLIQRLNQLTSPLAARSVEDTAFYRYGRLLSRNDVGFDAARFSLPVDEFHALMARRASDASHSMLALATHDHKRGADVRARLVVIGEQPDAWRDTAQHWFSLNEAVRPEGLDRGDEYQLYQMLVGTLPLEHSDAAPDYRERLSAWWVKALREAKLKTGWLTPNADYESAAEGFVAAILDPSRSADFIGSLNGYVDGIAPAAALGGLVQLILQATAPGIPDTYQGTEFWDLSMVDPDNRRPVDFDARRRVLGDDVAEDALCASWHDGRIKQSILHRLLTVRCEHPDLFVGAGYRALPVEGARIADVVAFTRESETHVLVVIAPLRCASAVRPDLSLADEWWGDTAIELPTVSGEWRSVLGGPIASGRLATPGTPPHLPCRVAVARR